MNEHDETTGPRKSRIPEFASREEEAEFWDTHDFTDYLDELEPIKVRVANPLSASVQVRFDTETDRELEEHAQEKGVKKSTLVRMVVKEWLRENRERHAS
jgi:hypothetical protein